MSREVLGCIVRPNPRSGLVDLARMLGDSRYGVTALDSSESVYVGLPLEGTSARIHRVFQATSQLSVSLWGWDGLPIDPSFGLPWNGVGDVPSSIPGEFSRRFILIAWDNLRHQLTVARDPLGLEAVYFSRLGVDAIAISSRLQALLRIPEVSRDPDPLSCAEALLELPRTAGGTMVRDVRELPRATVLTFSARSLTTRRFTATVPRWVHAAPDVQVAAMRERLHISVRKCIGVARHPGVAFSGGLDSSAMLAIAVGLRGADVTAVIQRFPGYPAAEETHYQERMLAHCPCRTSLLTPLSPLSWHDLMEHTDEPEWIPVSSLSTNWARHAGAIGLDCVISGVFGDHVGGMVRHPIDWLFSNERWHSAWQALGSVPGSWIRRNARFGMGILRSYIPHSAKAAMRRQQGWICAAHWLQCLSPAIRRAYDLDSRVQSLWLDSARPDTDFVAVSEAIFDGASRRVGAVRRLAERTSGIRIEDPFADVPLVDVSASLPFELRWKDGMNRIALRAAMTTLLPESVRLRRTKARLHGPHHDFYRHLGQGNGQLGLASLDELLDMRKPTSGPNLESDSGYWEFSVATAHSMASFIRMVLNRGATKAR